MILIRPATPADIPAIRALVQALAAYEREPDSVAITEDQLREDGFGTDRYYECLIAEEDGEAAGFALFFPVYSTWQGRSLHLEDLFVRPECRGRGIGKALLSRVAAIAVARRCVRLQWDVLDWNQPAIDFYHSLDSMMLGDWRRMRITGDALGRLAARNQAGR